MIFKKKNSVDTSASTSGENAIANKEVEGLSQSQIVRRRFFRHRAAVISLGVISFITVFVFTALDFRFLGIWHVNGWWKWSPQDIPDLRFGDCPNDTVGCPTISFRPKFMGGSGFGFGDHPFGQDDIGRDFFALVMKGTQRSLSVMIVIGTIGASIGTVVGAISGFYRGKVDAILMRFTDFIITIPAIIIGSVVGYHFGNLGAMFLAFYLGLFAWTGLSRLVRGEFLTLREREFVLAAESLGASHRRIIFRELLPSLWPKAIIFLSLSLPGFLTTEAALSFLGIGIQEPMPSWGVMLEKAVGKAYVVPTFFFIPAVTLIVLVTALNLVGTGVSDAFDPKLERNK